MQEVSIVFLVVVLLPVLVIVVGGGIAIAIIKALKAPAKGTGNKTSKQEAEIMQDIHRGLRKMEDRIESLETIIASQEHKERKS